MREFVLHQNVITRMKKTQDVRCRKCQKTLKPNDVVMGKTNGRKGLREADKKYYHKECFERMLL